MNRVTEILMERDGFSRTLAQNCVDAATEDLMEMIAEGASFDEVEDYMNYELGLEPDYIFDLLV